MRIISIRRLETYRRQARVKRISAAAKLATAVEQLEPRLIEDVAQIRGNKQRTPQVLGLSGNRLIKKLKQYGMTMGWFR